MQKRRSSASNVWSCCTLPPVLHYNPLSWMSADTNEPQKNPSKLSDWGRVCVRLSVSACKIILQGYLWLIWPMVAKRVYFWFGRRPLNCQLMQRKCYRQLVNFFWPWFQHRGKYMVMISQKLHSLNSDFALIFLWSYAYQEKWTHLYLGFGCRTTKQTQWTRGGQHIVLIPIKKQFNSDKYIEIYT